MMSPKTKQFLGGVLSGVLTIAIWEGITEPIAEHLTGKDDAPVVVCHAPTEDSSIVDCDYHDGAWWKENR
jgi:hypothetical protein